MTLPTTAVMSANPTGAGVLKGDTIIVAPLYQIVPFSSDYRTSDTAATLNASSNIVKVTAKGCLGTPGGLGTFYADAITAAQNALVTAQNARIAAGQPGGTNVLVLLSDGAATSTPAQMGPLKTTQVNQECHLAITAAQAAATAGTWVYAIYYDDGSTTCSDTTHRRASAACIARCSQHRQRSGARTASTYVTISTKSIPTTRRLRCNSVRQQAELSSSAKRDASRAIGVFSDVRAARLLTAADSAYARNRATKLVPRRASRHQR